MYRHSRALLANKSGSFSTVESVTGYEYRVGWRELLSYVDHCEINLEFVKLLILADRKPDIYLPVDRCLHGNQVIQ